MKLVILSVILIILEGCGSGIAQMSHSGICDGYTDWATSAYVLPWAAGQTHEIGQGNCGGITHIGAHRYAYDMRMDIGTQIIAARGGTVVALEEGKSDGNGCIGGGNFVAIRHTDGTLAEYVHLTKDGAQVALGTSVNQGDAIALSGNTGCSTGPHLHFNVYTDESKKDTVPVTFKNTQANKRGLQSGRSYTAQ